jgi:hypothetical protein
MPPLTDKQRVELGLIPVMLQGIIHAGAFPKDQSTHLAFLAKTAANEPLQDLNPGKFKQVYRRLTKVAHLASLELDQQSGVKIAMVLYYFTQDLLERGVLELAEGSPCASVLQTMIEYIERADGFDVAPLDRAAQKQARRLLREMNAAGYFVSRTALSAVA